MPSSNLKPIPKELLVQYYIEQKKTLYQTGISVGRNASAVGKWLRFYGIPVRGLSSSLRGKKKPLLSIARKGMVFSAEHRANLSKALTGKRGSLCVNWRGGLTELTDMIYALPQYQEWREKVFIRDDYRCQCCFVRGGKLESHHKREFRFVFSEFLQMYSQFSIVEDKETLCRLAITYLPFWDISNGETLCKPCHLKEHHIRRMSGVK